MTGLVLEGGGMRGMFTAGVLDVFLENNIKTDGVIGVSAGAAFGCNYVSNQPGRAIRYNKKFCRDKRYCSIKSLLTTGDLYNGDFCYNVVPNKLDLFDKKTFDESVTDFYVVCTDVDTGKPIYRKFDKADDEMFLWIRASASLPLVANIICPGDLKLMDGGISDSIPIRYFESIGYNKNIVVRTRPRGYMKSKNNILPLLRAKYGKYKEFIKALETRHEMYNGELIYIALQEQKGNALVICPEENLEISRLERNPDKLEDAYVKGREAALKKIDKIREFISDF